VEIVSQDAPLPIAQVYDSATDRREGTIDLVGGDPH